VYGKIILKHPTEIGREVVNWIYLAQGSIQWWALYEYDDCPHKTRVFLDQLRNNKLF
jgi:hypothetical protein